MRGSSAGKSVHLSPPPPSLLAENTAFLWMADLSWQHPRPSHIGTWLSRNADIQHWATMHPVSSSSSGVYVIDNDARRVPPSPVCFICNALLPWRLLSVAKAPSSSSLLKASSGAHSHEEMGNGLFLEFGQPTYIKCLRCTT